MLHEREWLDDIRTFWSRPYSFLSNQSLASFRFVFTDSLYGLSPSAPRPSTQRIHCAPRQQWPDAYLVLGLFQGFIRHGIKSFKNVHLHNPSLATTHIIQDPIDRLLRVVPRDGRFRVGEKSSVGRQRISGAVEDQKEQLRGLLQGFETP